MKIHDKSSFIWGLVFLSPLPFFILGLLKADWWQWLLSIGLSAKFLYTGLSKSESRRQRIIAENYQSVSRTLFGKYAEIKTNLPWILTAVFFAFGLLLRFVFDVILPVWIVIAFVVLLTISVFYSIGLNDKITEQIDKEMVETDSE